MTRKQDDQKAPLGADRLTRRGLGATDAEGRATTSTGEFPLVWPQLQESTEPPVARGVLPPPLPDDEETRAWQRPQSRGPEYHPPAPPAAVRERAVSGTGSSGTYRVGASTEPRARPIPVLDSEPPQRPSNPSVSPFERSIGRSSALPARLQWGSRRLWWPLAAGLVLGSALALTLVRVPVRAWGVLKATGAPEILSAQLSGSVGRLKVAAGDRVEPGDVVIELRSPELEYELEGRRSELERLRKEHEQALREEQTVQARNQGSLSRRRSSLEERLALKDAEFEQRKSLLDELSARADGAGAPAVLEATAAMQATREERLAVAEELSKLELEQSDRRSNDLVRERARRARLAEVEASVRRAEAALGAAAVRAPASGWVESLLVTPGSSVQPGAELARLVSRAPPRSVIALLASEDAADVAVGEEASVELAPPYGQSGAVFAARVRYVSREVAPQARVQAILGSPSSDGFVQLELERLDSTEYQALASQLRTGWRALVSLPTPRRRLGSVLVHAVRQWWDFRVWA